MNNKAVNLIVSIGGINLSNKCVKSLDIERNYTDVADKFTLMLKDTPQTNLTDLELAMCGGYRYISIAYSDNPNRGFVRFGGQIWDYSNTFVGDIKELTITGLVTLNASRDNTGKWLYNIDFNNYFNMRPKSGETDFWGALKRIKFSRTKYDKWLSVNETKYEDDTTQYTVYNSDVVYPEFNNLYYANAETISIKGPGGSIALPVPEPFVELVIYNKDEADKREEANKNMNVTGYITDLHHKSLWGDLRAFAVKTDATIADRNKSKKWEDLKLDSDPENPKWEDAKKYKEKLEEAHEDIDIYFIGSDDKIRGFWLKEDSKPYIQMKHDKNYFGASVYLYDKTGVDISQIIRQLCKLEGWKIGTIVQTELVPASDAFKMNNRSAIDFITEVLIPMSVTPVGQYKTLDGKDTTLETGDGGFQFYFDADGKANYKPLQSYYDRDKTDITLGYNIPDTPVISFQVETKGTAFYTTNPVVMNSMSLVTGVPQTAVDTLSKQQTVAYNKVKIHNEVLDKFFGYTYDEVQKIIKDNKFTKYEQVYSWLNNNAKFVTQLNSSAVINQQSLSTAIRDAKAKIQSYMITASMTLWGNAEIRPASLIQVTNMIKSTSTGYSEKHPTSGTYLITKQKDSISGDTFTQTLSMYRANNDLADKINPKKIDYSKGISEAKLPDLTGGTSPVDHLKKPTNASDQNKGRNDRHDKTHWGQTADDLLNNPTNTKFASTDTGLSSNKFSWELKP